MNSTISSPKALRSEQITITHGVEIRDEYAWLREKDRPEVLEYLREENQYTNTVMADTVDLQSQLFEELKGRMPEADMSAPVPDGPYVYYSRTELGKNYSIYCRRPRVTGSNGTHQTTEEVLLDGNLLADGQDYLEIGAYSVSPDHNLLAYSVDYAGDEKFRLHIRNLETGELLSDSVEDISYSVEWSACGRFLFYTTLDDTLRPYRLWRHCLGESASADTLIFEEPDQSFHLDIGKTRSEKYFLLEVGSLTTSEVRILPSDDPEGEFRVFLPRKREIEYSVEHQGDFFWFTINDTGRNFRLMRVPLDADWADASVWQEVVAHRTDVCLEGLDGFAEYLVVSERANGLPRLCIHHPSSGTGHHLLFPEAVYTAAVGRNAEYVSTTLRISYSSLASPPMAVDYGMASREWAVVKQKQVLGDFKPSDYVVERLHATAPDGVSVPISLVYRKGLKRDGSAPALLYGYGAYGLTVEPGFSADRFSLLERGVVYALAHIRGGGDLGETWHDAGKMKQKTNTFSDFIACAETLIAGGYTSSAQLAILGRSAGGLLVGAVVNQRPDLFGAVVASVPFVDVLNTMLDPTLPLTVGEYEEWGNPQEQEYFELIRSYSPYDNVRKADYPHMLVTGGLNDPRVSYWEPAKFVAKLRETRTNDGLLLLKTELGAGHFGPSGRYDAWKETAFEYAFLLKCFGFPAKR